MMEAKEKLCLCYLCECGSMVLCLLYCEGTEFIVY